MKLIHIRINKNFIMLMKAGLDSMMARAIAIKLRISALLEVSISDKGVHVHVEEEGVEKNYVFSFIA